MRITEGTLNPKPISSPPFSCTPPTCLLTGASHVEKCCVDFLHFLILVSLGAFFFLFVSYIFELSSEYYVDARFFFFCCAF
jgi:hypothetical protein